MNSRVYYGEYSLKHWIELILKTNITLPPYQRHFVWNEKKVETLMATFKKKQFVPPVILGAYKIGDTNRNLILDGQQRLTSIFLAYLDLYPNQTTYRSVVNDLADENDENDENNGEGEDFNMLEWDLSYLTRLGSNKSDILDKIKTKDYQTTQYRLHDNFLKNTYLGFSYIVPYTNSEVDQQKYFSSVFRNINIQGQSLLYQESRAALYFLDPNLNGFFSPDFFKKIFIKSLTSELRVDVVRYVSILFQYKKDGNSNRIAKGYKSSMEKYYEEFIYSVIGEDPLSIFESFEVVFPGKNFSDRMARLDDTIQQISLPVLRSIIDADLFLFGLIYHVLIEGKEFDNGEFPALKDQLQNKINLLKEDQYHVKSPNALKYLKSRIESSIDICRAFINE